MAHSLSWRSTLLVSSVLLAVATVGCGRVDVPRDDQPAGTSAPAPVAVATVPTPPTTPVPPPMAGGTPFVAADGRFSAQFPDAPARAEGGDPVNFVFYSALTDSDLPISVGYGDYPKGWLDDPLAVLRTTAEVEGILSRKMSTFLGRPAYDVVVRRPDKPATPYLHERSFFVGSRIYFLQGSSTTPAAPPEYATMLTSFKLTA